MGPPASLPRRLLILGVTGRALAQSARRSGRQTVVLDSFGDTDTREAAGETRVVRLGPAGLTREELVAEARRSESEGMVYGGGVAKRPELLRRLAEVSPIWGNGPEVAATSGDSRSFFGLLKRLGIPYPELRRQSPREFRTWLIKAVARDGGGHIREAGPDTALAEGEFYQRRVEGVPVSVLFLADGRDCRTVGFNRLLPARGPVPTFQYGGAVRDLPPEPGVREDLESAARRLTRALGLVGLNGLDAISGGGRARVLELNPRPTATAELHESAMPGGMLESHLNACRGRLPEARVPEGPFRAVAVVYARERVAIPGRLAWPAWASDRPGPGSVLEPGQPVCTVHARAGSPQGAEARVRERQQWMERWLHDNDREAG